MRKQVLITVLRDGGYPRISIGCEKIGGKGRIFAPFIV